MVSRRALLWSQFRCFHLKKKGGGLQAALLVSVLCKVERSFLAQSVNFSLLLQDMGKGKCLGVASVDVFLILFLGLFCFLSSQMYSQEDTKYHLYVPAHNEVVTGIQVQRVCVGWLGLRHKHRGAPASSRLVGIFISLCYFPCHHRFKQLLTFFSVYFHHDCKFIVFIISFCSTLAV